MKFQKKIGYQNLKTKNYFVQDNNISLLNFIKRVKQIVIYK